MRGFEDFTAGGLENPAQVRRPRRNDREDVPRALHEILGGARHHGQPINRNQQLVAAESRRLPAAEQQRADHSAFTPAILITFSNRTRSAARSAMYSWGPAPTTSMPRTFSLSTSAGSLSASIMSSRSFATIACASPTVPYSQLSVP